MTAMKCEGADICGRTYCPHCCEHERHEYCDVTCHVQTRGHGCIEVEQSPPIGMTQDVRNALDARLDALDARLDALDARLWGCANTRDAKGSADE